MVTLSRAGSEKEPSRASAPLAPAWARGTEIYRVLRETKRVVTVFSGSQIMMVTLSVVVALLLIA
jgi:hypothetical protein